MELIHESRIKWGVVRTVLYVTVRDCTWRTLSHNGQYIHSAASFDPTRSRICLQRSSHHWERHRRRFLCCGWWWTHHGWVTEQGMQVLYWSCLTHCNECIIPGTPSTWSRIVLTVVVVDLVDLYAVLYEDPIRFHQNDVSVYVTVIIYCGASWIFFEDLPNLNGWENTESLLFTYFNAFPNAHAMPLVTPDR